MQGKTSRIIFFLDTGSWIWNCKYILNFAGPQAVIWDINLYAALKKYFGQKVPVSERTGKLAKA
jgi:hypothetical protein